MTTLNDNDEIIDDWNDDCYDEGYVPSFETVGECIQKRISCWVIDANKQTKMKNHREPSQR